MLLRHNVVLLSQGELVEAAITGPVHQVRPSDGDGLQDGQQRWWALVDLAREGDGVVAAVVSTSFDGTVWFPVATVSTRRSTAVTDLVELKAFAPLLRVETQGDGVLPRHRVTVRLASGGPFTAVPG